MKLADFAETKIGIKEGTQPFKNLINDYNNNCRKSGTYKMSYTDSWCACFVSICLTHCGYGTKYNSVDCDELYSNLSRYRINKNDAKRNDIIFYSWKKTDDDLQHIGIIQSRFGNYVNVVEGNRKNSVSVRQINIYDSTVRKIVRVPNITTETKTSYDVTAIAKEVIQGRYGNGEARKKALTAKGYDYKTVQKKVNELLKNR